MEVSENPMLHRSFVLEAYHIYVISDIAGRIRLAPVLLRLVAQLVAGAHEPASCITRKVPQPVVDDIVAAVILEAIPLPGRRRLPGRQSLFSPGHFVTAAPIRLFAGA
ncbi:hypothetical protein [Paraburkholderia phosphatilytica]|uniref:hypothetical protein n=1 Tax=Paraburkholderia phosphatilytica TaxID=2282883 RepID=UPI000F60292E|nr:hypothetical protein [Paraburkholderia phosphatilytica]